MLKGDRVMRQALQLRKPVSLSRPLRMTLLAGLIGFGGCASPDLVTGEAQVRQPPQAHETAPSAESHLADFQTVECLLPLRIRRLATQRVYLEPRHEITTTSRDCAMRGGETVAQDAPKAAA